MHERVCSCARILVCVAVAILVSTAAWLPPSAGAQGTHPPPLISGCFGDCDGNQRVSVAELVTLINMALGSADACGAIRQTPSIDVVTFAVGNALGGCPATITYTLTEESSILYTPPGPGSLRGTPRPLAGTFVVTNAEDPSPNSRFALTILDIALESEEVSVTRGQLRPGCSGFFERPDFGFGCISAITFDFESMAYLSGLFSFNGQVLDVSAVGQYGGECEPATLLCPNPTLHELLICRSAIASEFHVTCDEIRSGEKSGYVLVISAAPEETDVGKESPR